MKKLKSKVQQLKAQTAEALSKAGVISKEEYENIKKETEKIASTISERKESLDKELAELNSKTENKPDESKKEEVKEEKTAETSEKKEKPKKTKTTKKKEDK